MLQQSAEALALYLQGTELAETPGLEEAPALSSALDKLAAAGSTVQLLSWPDNAPIAPELLDVLSRAPFEEALALAEQVGALPGAPG